MKHSLFYLLLIATFTGFSQQGNDKESGKIYEFVVIEQKPEFPGGFEALVKYLSENIKYPEVAVENKITGTVYVGFVISKKGKVIDVKILKSVNPLLDAEALRVVSLMPKWKPGKQKGKRVKVAFQLPIKFIL